MRFSESALQTSAGERFVFWTLTEPRADFGRFTACRRRSFVPASLQLQRLPPPEPPADLVIVNGNEPESLDPRSSPASPKCGSPRRSSRGCCDWTREPRRPVPALAERWEVSPDGTTYTFHLRTNAGWSTGEPITAADVVYLLASRASPATAARLRRPALLHQERGGVLHWARSRTRTRWAFGRWMTARFGWN